MNPPDPQYGHSIQPRAEQPLAHGQPMHLAQVQQPAMAQVSSGTSQSAVKRSIISVEEIFEYLRKYWLIATLIGLCAAVGIFAYLQSRPPVYESTSVILLNNNSGKKLNLQTMEPDERSEYNLPQLVNNLKNEIETDKFRLSLYQAISPELRKKIIGKLSVEEQLEDEGNVFLSRVSNMVGIDVLKDSHMVSVTVKSDDKMTAAELANTYVTHFQNYVSEQEQQITRKVVAFLKSKSEELLNEVKAQEKELLEYRRSRGVTNAQGESDFIADKITVLNTQLVDAKLQEERLRDTLQAIQQTGSNPEEILKVPALAENDTLERAYEKLRESRARVAELKTDFGRRHPTMINAVSQEKSAYADLSKLVAQAVASFKRQHSNTSAKVAGLEAKVNSTKNEMVAAGNISVSQQLMEQQLKTSRDLYNSLILQMNEATLSLQFNGVERVRITEKALVQKDPVFPSKPLSAVVAGIAFGSCFFGIPLTLGFGQRVISMARKDEEEFVHEEIQAPVDPANTLTMQPEYEQFAAPVHSSFPAQQGGGFPTLITFPPVSDIGAGAWVRHVNDLRSRSGADLNHFVSQVRQSGFTEKGIILTSEKPNPAKALTAAAVCLAASRQGLTTLLVSSENLVPSIEPRLRNRQYQQAGQHVKTREELLSPFSTEEENLYFITDEAWKRIPILCLETLCNANQCVDILVLDAPLMPDETSLTVMAQFASRCIVVRNESDYYDFPKIQSMLQRTMPNFTIEGEFMIASS
ncbi:MAG: GumC family protein [Akkermansiaceae bacterium]